jgi:hypothetical protein
MKILYFIIRFIISIILSGITTFYLIPYVENGLSNNTIFSMLWFKIITVFFIIFLIYNILFYILQYLIF